MNHLIALLHAVPAQTHGSDPVDTFLNYLFGAFIVVAGIYFWLRNRRMKAIVNAPETEEEKAVRLQLPPGLKESPSLNLVRDLREDLRNADAYLETAEKALSSSTSLAALDIIGFEGDAGAGGPKQEAMSALFNDLMQADKFLIDARHRLTILGERTDLEAPLPVAAMDTVTLDWVADNPLSDFITYRRLMKLKPKLEKLRKSVADLRTKVAQEPARF